METCYVSTHNGLAKHLAVLDRIGVKYRVFKGVKNHDVVVQVLGDDCDGNIGYASEVTFDGSNGYPMEMYVGVQRYDTGDEPVEVKVS